MACVCVCKKHTWQSKTWPHTQEVRSLITNPSSACFPEAFFKFRRGEEDGGRGLSSRGPSRLAEDSVRVESEEEERGEGGQGESERSLWFSDFLALENSGFVS